MSNEFPRSLSQPATLQEVERDFPEFYKNVKEEAERRNKSIEDTYWSMIATFHLPPMLKADPFNKPNGRLGTPKSVYIDEAAEKGNRVKTFTCEEDKLLTQEQRSKWRQLFSPCIDED